MGYINPRTDTFSIDNNNCPDDSASDDGHCSEIYRYY